MISLNNVTKKFESRGIAGVNGVSLELKKGEIVAVMGPNGSGKTTLINLIANRILPDSGSVKVEGEVRIFTSVQDVEDMNVQKFLIKQNKQDIDEEKKLQLARDFADIFEFTFQLRQNLSQLSAGQRQKVSLSAELINRPSLLLMDEPFTHLDPHTRKDILNALFTYIRNQETSVLWVTHDLNEAMKLSDRVGILNFGKFEQLDTPLAIFDKPKNLFVSQFLGFENFFPIKKENESWQTPWGKTPANDFSKDEAILVIPRDAWKFSEQGLEGKVLNQTISGTQKILSVLLGDKEIQVQVPRSTQNMSLKLIPDFTNCFIIPL